MRRFFARLFGTTSKPVRRPARYRPAVEGLEDRRVLSGNPFGSVTFDDFERNTRIELVTQMEKDPFWGIEGPPAGLYIVGSDAADRVDINYRMIGGRTLVEVTMDSGPFGVRAYLSEEFLPIRFWGRGGDDVYVNNTAIDEIEVRGGAGDDTLVGGTGRNGLMGGADNDRLRGRSYGTLDRILDAEGNFLGSQYDGGDGNDVIYGSDRQDGITGGDGDDRIYGCGGNDSIYAGAGDDLVYGDDLDWATWGRFGNDMIFGMEGNDTLYGMGGDDALYGGADADHLYGNAGLDTLQGDTGADFLDGGRDGLADVLKGQRGADTFQVHLTAGLLPEDRNADFSTAAGDRLRYVDFHTGALLEGNDWVSPQTQGFAPAAPADEPAELLDAAAALDLVSYDAAADLATESILAESTPSFGESLDASADLDLAPALDTSDVTWGLDADLVSYAGPAEDLAYADVGISLLAEEPSLPLGDEPAELGAEALLEVSFAETSGALADGTAAVLDPGVSVVTAEWAGDAPLLAESPITVSSSATWSVSYPRLSWYAW